MFHIGVATQHPPLPEHGQLSEKGIDFIKQCLTIDPMQRPTALELMEHPWMLDFQDFLRTFEKQELATSPPAELPTDPAYEQASVARQAAIEKEKETTDNRLKDLATEMKSLKTLVGSRMGSAPPRAAANGLAQVNSLIHNSSLKAAWVHSEHCR